MHVKSYMSISKYYMQSIHIPPISQNFWKSISIYFLHNSPIFRPTKMKQFVKNKNPRKRQYFETIAFLTHLRIFLLNLCSFCLRQSMMPSWSANCTNPKPLHSPLSRSLTSLTETIGPNCLKYNLTSSSSVCLVKLPTKTANFETNDSLSLANETFRCLMPRNYQAFKSSFAHSILNFENYFDFFSYM